MALCRGRRRRLARHLAARRRHRRRFPPRHTARRALDFLELFFESELSNKVDRIAVEFVVFRALFWPRRQAVVRAFVFVVALIRRRRARRRFDGRAARGLRRVFDARRVGRRALGRRELRALLRQQQRRLDFGGRRRRRGMIALVGALLLLKIGDVASVIVVLDFVLHLFCKRRDRRTNEARARRRTCACAR